LNKAEQVLIPVKQHSNLEALFHSLGLTKSFDRNAFIDPILDMNTTLYMITDGAVRVLLNSNQGDGVVHLGYLLPGDIIGEIGLFDLPKNELSNLSYQARGVVRLKGVSHREIRQSALANPSLMDDVAGAVNRQFDMTIKRLSQLVFLDLDNRILECLKSVSLLPDAMTHPEGMQVSLTRIELAQMAHCSRESAGRSLKRLAQAGFISVKGQKIVLRGIRYGITHLPTATHKRPIAPCTHNTASPASHI
tara:strand:+ start:532 stop:1278 length:747 start_codon:yes stop_codon:yes gene_type:complete